MVRIRLSKLVEDEGFESLPDALEEWVHADMLPALCDEGCEVEPDGVCEHGCPSPLMAAGLV